MKPRNTLIMLLILALAGGFYYFYEVKGGKARKDKEEAEKKVFKEVPWDKASEVKLTTSEEPNEIVIKKGDDGVWTITGPFEAEADQGQIDSIVNGLKNLNSDGVVEEKPEDLKKFGLEKPGANVTVSFKEGSAPVTLHVGNKTKVGYKVYIKKEGDESVLMTGAYFWSTANKKLFDLREKRVIPFERKDLKGMDIELPERKISLKKEGENWQLTEPLKAPADKSQVDKLLSTLSGLKIEKFEQEDPQDLSIYGLVSPRLKLSLRIGEGDSSVKTLLLGNSSPDKKIYGKRGEKKPVFLVRDKAIEDLTKEPKDLRDKKVLAFERGDVQAIEITGAKGTLKVAKGEDDKWKIKAPAEGDADQSNVNTMLITLKGLEAKDFIDADIPAFDSIGLSPAEMTVNLLNKDGGIITSLLVGKEKDSSGTRYVKSSSYESVNVVDGKFMSDIPQTVDDLKKKETGKSGTFEPEPSSPSTFMPLTGEEDESLLPPEDFDEEALEGE